MATGWVKYLPEKLRDGTCVHEWLLTGAYMIVLTPGGGAHSAACGSMACGCEFVDQQDCCFMAGVAKVS